MLIEPIYYDPFRGKLVTDPGPDEIALRAAEIRAKWDTTEELLRRQIPSLPWTVPAARVDFGHPPGGAQPRPRAKRD